MLAGSGKSYMSAFLTAILLSFFHSIHVPTIVIMVKIKVTKKYSHNHQEYTGSLRATLKSKKDVLKKV